MNGTLDGIKDKTSYQQFKVEGTWYNISNSNASDVSNGDTVQAYIVNGVIVKIKSDDGKGGYPTNIAVVVSNGTINGDQVRIRYFDGTSKLVTISDNTTVTLTAGTAYKVSGADTSMKFENVSSIKYNGYLYEGNGTADPDGDKVVATIPAAAGQTTTKDIKVDDSASVILYDGQGRSKMLTGKQYNALATSSLDLNSTTTGNQTEVSAIFTKETKGLTRAMMVAVKTPRMTVSGNSSDNYAYVVSNNGQNKDGNASYTIWTTDNKYVDVIEENASAMAKGELIGYSSIDSNGVIKDVTRITNVSDIATSNQTNASTVTGNFQNDDTVYYGSNRSDDTKFITVANKKLKVTADTAVLFVDSAADEDNQIGVNYTYGTTAMAKAEEYASNSYSYNVMFMVDETKADDVNLKVLVVDTTGAFKGQKHNDSDNSTKDNTKDSETSGIKVTTEVVNHLKAGSQAETLTMTAVVSKMLGYTPAVTIEDAQGADATAKFTVAPISKIPTNNDTMLDVSINNNGAPAGKYVLTLTVGGEKVVRNFTVAEAQ